MSSKDCKCPVQLFAYDNPDQLMGQSHGTQRQQQSRFRPLFIRPSIGRTHGKHYALLPVIALPSKPFGERLRRELLSTPIEQD